MNKNELILTTALRLFVENGFHGTATSKIALESGVATGTLFNYYPSKELLIISLYNVINKKFDNYLTESLESYSVSKESFRSLFSATVLWYLDNRLEYRYLQQFNNSPYYNSVVTNNLILEEHPLYVLLQNGINLVLLKPMPVDLLFSLFNAQINGLYEFIILQDKKQEEWPKLIDDIFELLWKMIKD
ncbi:TetR/AcrR family transcriptional regulator [Flavobacterium adhaerens]|uniref:TetR/AcrR family transcriptional regulator n=1 Tax=Flavobacterium adhaerens TaxID=3149043 RepID=UPI0032B32AE8